MPTMRPSCPSPHPNSGEFIEDQIYNWTYSDEQRAKENWDGAADNPYAALPRMVMMTYRIPDSIRQIAMQGQFDEFDLNVFFSAKYGEKSKPETARFVYENEVQKWLDLIRGSYLPASVDAYAVFRYPVAECAVPHLLVSAQCGQLLCNV